jgi:hypothetical protein
MQQAYKEVHLTKSSTLSDVTLSPTDIYVRFLPKDSMEMRILEEDLNLELFCYPLDYDIVVDGTTYHDPSIPEDQITWQYTTVKPDFVFPQNIAYEILEECYIPDEDDEDDEDESEEEIVTKGGSVNWKSLELKAFEIAGLLEKFTKNEEAKTKGLFGKSYYPTGTIRVYDDILGRLEGVKGVKIRCHVVVKWSTTFTNESGYYRMDSKFSLGPHYAIVFDNAKGFDIYGNWGPLAKANYGMGWHTKTGYSVDLYKNSVAWDWCTVNNAGYDYYRMCETEGILKPPSTLKVWVFRHKENISSAPMLSKISDIYGFKANGKFVNFLNAFFINLPANLIVSWFRSLMPDITIGCKGSNTQRIYENVNHEFAHASHFSQVGQSFWADYVSYIITYKGYSGPSAYNSGVCGVGEMWGYAIGYIQEYEKYTGELRNQREPPAYRWTDYWFKPQIFWELYRDGVMSKKQIFNSLKFDVRNHIALKDRMVQLSMLSPARINAINMAFFRHGYYKYKGDWEILNNSGRTLIIETRINGITNTATISSGQTVNIASFPECAVFTDFMRDGRTVTDFVRVRNAQTNTILKTWNESQANSAGKQFFREDNTYWIKVTSTGPKGTNSKWIFALNDTDI